jgi:hypothetical protein
MLASIDSPQGDQAAQTAASTAVVKPIAASEVTTTRGRDRLGTESGGPA